MGIFRKFVSMGKNLSDFFAYDLHNKYYFYFFNGHLKKFVGTDTPLSEECQKQIDDLWKNRYNIKVDKRWFAHFKHCYGVESPYYVPDNVFHPRG